MMKTHDVGTSIPLTSGEEIPRDTEGRFQFGPEHDEMLAEFMDEDSPSKNHRRGIGA